MNFTSIMIGGIVPAICLGLGTVLMRASIGAGASIPVYLASVGTIIALVGWSWTAANGFAGATMPGIGFAVCMGLVWTTAISCMAYGVGPLKLPVAIIAPLSNSNAIVAVLLGSLAFGEWRSLHMPQVAIGTLLICAGATCVSLAK
jgi:transporter family protein